MPLKIEILSIMIGYEAYSHKSNIKSHALRPTPYIDYPIYFQVSPLSLYLAIASPLHYSTTTTKVNSRSVVAPG